MVVDYHSFGPPLRGFMWRWSRPISTLSYSWMIIYFLRRLGPLKICRKFLQMFYQVFYAVVCWEGSIKERNTMRLDKLVRQASFVISMEMDSMVAVAKRKTLWKLFSIVDNDSHPLHTTIMKQQSMFSGRLFSVR